MTGTAVTAASGRRQARERYRFADAARMEFRKLRTLRSTFWIAVATAVVMVGVAILVLSYYPAHWANLSATQRAQFDPTNMGFAGLAFAQLAIGVAGVLTMTAEYSSGSMRSSLAAIPSRRLLLAAKAAVLGLAALLLGELACLTAFLISQYLVLGAPAPHASLGQPGVLRAVLMSGAYVGFTGLLGLGLGAIIRHTAGSITALAGALIVLPEMLHLLPGGAGRPASNYLPMLIAENSLSAVRPVAGALSPWAGMALLAGYAAAVLLAGGWLLARRDA
jgi:ABC-2 type transport system permease protein